MYIHTNPNPNPNPTIVSFLQVLACRDVLAQQYLMECVIQAFSDEFHLQTLPQLMATVSKLEKGVQVRPANRRSGRGHDWCWR